MASYGKYLKTFDTHAEYLAYIQDEPNLPNVSFCKNVEEEVHFNPYTTETRIICYYNVQSTSSATQILYNNSVATQFEYFIADGEKVVVPSIIEYGNVYNTYTFSNTGERKVIFKLRNDTTLANETFRNCESLTQITLPNNITTIGSSVFLYCTLLTNVKLPDNLTVISGLFNSCTNLRNLLLPNTITEIGTNSFRGSGITNITIPSTITNIGYSAFYGCNSLTSVTVLATTPPTLGNSVFGNNPSNRKIYVPAASVDTYKAASGWSTYASAIEAIPS